MSVVVEAPPCLEKQVSLPTSQLHMVVLAAYNVLLHPQLANASSPMLVTLIGMTTDVRLLHSRNAESPMSVTLSGITTDSRLLHPKNAPPAMLVTLSPISTDARLLQL